MRQCSGPQALQIFLLAAKPTGHRIVRVVVVLLLLGGFCHLSNFSLKYCYKVCVFVYILVHILEFAENRASEKVSGLSSSP